MEMWLVLLAVLAGSLLIIWFQCCSFLVYHLWRPKVLEKVMSAQGVTGPPQKNLLTQIWELPDMEQVSHDIVPHAIPLHHACLQKYGPLHMNWWRVEPRVELADIDLMRKALLKGPEFFGKSPVLGMMADDIFGGGVFDASGRDWVEQRRVVVPVFHADKIKGMVRTMYENTQNFLENWETLVRNGGTGEKALDVFPEFVELTALIIGQAAFGTSSSTSIAIVKLLRLLFALQSQQVRYVWMFPFIRSLPFLPMNRERWRIKREIHRLLHVEIDSRRAFTRENCAASHGSDLLGTMLDSNWDDELIITESKTFYTTGHMSLTSLYSWVMLLLAVNPEWQEKARVEVLELVAREGPLDNAKALDKLKLVEMTIMETLRLYPAFLIIPRVALRDCYVDHIFIPKGLAVSVHNTVIQHSAEMWGEDANEFNPGRFANGSLAASKHPMAFMPFSFGPRACVGRAYSQVQAKVVVASLLQRFRWSLSPDYRHNPMAAGTLLPKNGVPIVLKLLDSKTIVSNEGNRREILT
ncbi:cytokinin hydroxylase [Selaginella moellendorffii]|uniref:cytokinin hydroxylase n=1 Tax=Selaginella moellendorffii TaxID=88036 RepID=UPI000D1C2F27|nr:cytokinin hydroxylase [Selaginella moellendorffii]|eukprot:XP_024515000.1 cytokinin hydroxylase [Selaginella moellendorffii]